MHFKQEMKVIIFFLSIDLWSQSVYVPVVKEMIKSMIQYAHHCGPTDKNVITNIVNAAGSVNQYLIYSLNPQQNFTCKHLLS